MKKNGKMGNNCYVKKALRNEASSGTISKRLASFSHDYVDIMEMEVGLNCYRLGSGFTIYNPGRRK